jgi:CheY-like chemotaxis protein
VCIDPNQVEQAIINLVVNARDALPSGGYIHLGVSRETPRAEELAAAGLTKPGEYARLYVKDNGIGMSAEVRDRIFEPFFTTKSSGKGTGLGLASVYGLVRQSNGSILVDTAVGVGTTFTIFFPTAAALDVTRSPEDASAGASAQRETVLLVEDEDSVRRVIRVMLEQHGYNVIEAATPADACTIFERHAHEIRVLVTDVVMPGMNGPALAQRLVAIEPQLTILFVSGYTDVDTATLGLNHRNVGFLSKPIDRSQLSAKIRELLAIA